MKKKANLILCSLILLLGGSLMPAQSDTAAAGPEGAAAKKVKCPRKAPVLLETVKPAAFSEYRYLSGQAQSEVVAVASPVAGIVSEIKVSQGSLVEAGQVLAVLNAGLDEKLRALEQDAAKKKKILTNRQNWKVRNERAVQVAERDYQAALALVEDNKAQANRAIQAPLAGIVRIKTAANAEVALETPLFEIVDPLRLRINAVLPADAAGFFVVGEKLMGAAEGVSAMLDAEIVAVSASQVSFLVNNSDRQLREGMTINCKKLKAEHADAIVIPTAAVQHDSLGVFVYAAEKKKAKKLYVTLGASDAGRTMIEKGLGADTQLIVSGFECLADQKKIRAVNEKEMAREKAKAKAGLEVEVAPVVAAAAGLEDFVAYLEAHKEALGYTRYEKSEWKGLPAVKVFSGRDTQKKLLDIIPQFAVSEVTFELQEEQRIVSTIAFHKPGEYVSEKEKLARKEETSRTRFHNRLLKIGVHGAYFMILNQNFKNAYGGGLIGFGGELSYRFSNKMDFWISGGMASKKVTPAWSDGDTMQFKLIPLSAAGRYYLTDKGKLSTFVGAGLNVFLVKDLNPVLDVKSTLIGFNALAGLYYNLSNKLSAQLMAKFNLIKKDLVPDSNVDDPLDLSGLELLFGISYSI